MAGMGLVHAAKALLRVHTVIGEKVAVCTWCGRAVGGLCSPNHHDCTACQLRNALALTVADDVALARADVSRMLGGEPDFEGFIDSLRSESAHILRCEKRRATADGPVTADALMELAATVEAVAKEEVYL